MKNFLKLTATFACLFTLFSACNTDDTVDGYVPVFTAIDSEKVSVTRGDSKIQVVWDVPSDENINGAKISWSSSAESGSDVIDDFRPGDEGVTYTIGVDDYRYDAKTESIIPLPAGEYKITIQHMEGKYVGTGGYTSEPITVYNKEYYEGQYPEYESIEHKSTDKATITWESFPDDCVEVLVNFTSTDEDGEVVDDFVVVDPADFDFTSSDAQITELEGAVIDSEVTFTPSFRPEDALEDDTVTIDTSAPIKIEINASIKAEPTIVAAMGGNERLYIEWIVYNGMDIDSTTIGVYDSEGNLVGTELEVLYDQNYEYVSESSEYNVAGMQITESSYTGGDAVTIETGKLYTVKLVNNISSTGAKTSTIESDEMFVYGDNTYTTAPGVFSITHSGESAFIVWDMAVLQAETLTQNGLCYTGEESDPDYLDYYALDKIVVTYDTTTAEDQEVEFTSDITSHFALECELPDAKIGTKYSYVAYFRPASAQQKDTNYAEQSVETPEPSDIPAPLLAPVTGVSIYSGYNSDDSSYLQVGWSDVAGALGSVNDNIDDVLIFYTQDEARITAMGDLKVDDCDYGNDYEVALAAWKADVTGSVEGTSPAEPISIKTLLGDYDGNFVEDIVEEGYTITIGKSDDGTGITNISANKTYYIAVVTKGKVDEVNINGQFAFTNVDAYNPDDVNPDYNAETNPYVDRNVTTYNSETYTSVEDNKQIFSVNKPSLSRNRTDAIIEWEWEKYAEETETAAKDVVAVGVKSYTQNTGESYAGGEVKVYAGESTTLANAKAGTAAIPAYVAESTPEPATYGYTAYFCPASGLDEVAIEQTMALDIPFLAVPTPELLLKVGVNNGTEGVTDTNGEPYIQTAWSVDDTYSDNVASYKVYYQQESAGAYNGEYSSVADIASGDRAYDIAPIYNATAETKANHTENNLLVADNGYKVYISCVDLDGYERPSTTIDTPDSADAIDGAKETTTYDLQTYSDQEMKLADYVEELAFDGETLTVTWGGFGDAPVGNIANNNKDLQDCVGVLVKMTTGDRENQTFGYNYMLEETTKVPDVEESDELEYTTYFRPADGLTIVAGKTTTTSTFMTGAEPAVTKLVVPVSTAPTKAVITSIESTYDESDKPAISLEWTFDEDDAAGMPNILAEGGKKYLYLHWYRDDVDGITATNASGTNGGTVQVEIGDDREVVEVEGVKTYKYSYTIPQDRLTVGDVTASYTIYVGTKNTNSVEYASQIFDEVKTYNSASYSVSDLPEALTVESGYNNDIEVAWDEDKVMDDLRTIYLSYNGGISDDFNAKSGAASVAYVKGVNSVIMNGKFGPDYDQFMSEYDADYKVKFGVVKYPKEIDIKGTTVLNAVITSYDITYSFDDDTYRIITAKGFGAFADIVNGTTTFSGDEALSSRGITDWSQYRSANGVLTNDIDLSAICGESVEASWAPIGGTATASSYMGTFDGAGYNITGLYISAAAAYQGLFGYINSATIKNINLVAPSINIEYAGAVRYIGGIASYATGATISNCHVKGGNISNKNTVGSANTAETGGIVGVAAAQTTVVDCTNSSTIVAEYSNYVGGIAGQLNAGFIINCHNTTDIICPLVYGTIATPVASMSQFVGGIVGNIANTTPNIVVGCSNTGDVQGHKWVGGVAGSSNAESDGTYIVSSFNTGDITSTDQYTGGIVGCLPATASKLCMAGCYNTGSIFSYYSSESYATMYGIWAGAIVGGFVNQGAVTDEMLVGIEDNYFMYAPYITELINPVLWAVGVKNSYLNEENTSWSGFGYNSPMNADIVEDYTLFNGRVGDMNDAADVIYAKSNYTKYLPNEEYKYYLNIANLASAPEIVANRPNITSPKSVTNVGFKTLEQDLVQVSWEYGNGQEGISNVIVFTSPEGSDVWTEHPVSNGSYSIELKLEEMYSPNYNIYIRTRGTYGEETATEYTKDEPYNISVSMDPPGLDLKWFGEGQPYQIYTAKGLKAFAQIVNGDFVGVDDEGLITTGVIEDGVHNSSADGRLMKNIVLEGDWSTPIGTATASGFADFSDAEAYSGTFDGNGMTISNFKLSTSNACQGLFGYISGATIKDVNLVDASVNASNYYGSALVGVAMAESTIEDCEVSGTVTFGFSASGVIAGGVIGGSKVINCVNNATITASGSYTGAIVGDLRNSTIDGSVNNGEMAISGAISNIGGIVGAATSTSATLVTAVTNSDNNADITGSATSYVGGVVGYVDNKQADTANGQAYIENSDNYGDVVITGATSYICGILGGASNLFQILESSNFGDVTAQTADYVAGIVGSSKGYSIVRGDVNSRSYNRGAITGNGYVGGIVGSNGVAISYYNNTGLVTGTSNYGQLIGESIQGSAIAECEDEYSETDVDIRYLAYGIYEINTSKGLKAFAGIVNGTHTVGVAPEGVTSFGITGVSGINWAKNANASALVNSSFTHDATVEGTIPAMVDYTGTFDGGIHTITDLEITGNGLFANILQGAVVKNLILHNPYITRDGENAGAFVGKAISATIFNCHVTADDTAKHWATDNADTDFNEKRPTILSKGGRRSGGIVGYACGGVTGDVLITQEMSIIACSNAGYVPNSESGAGIVGAVESINSVPMTVKYCMNTADFYFGRYSGGIVGNLESGNTAAYINVASCTNYGDISTGASPIGGVTGTAGGNIIHCANYGDVTSTTTNAAGIAGQTHGPGALDGARPTDYNESIYRIYGTPLFDVESLGGDTNYGNITAGGDTTGGIAGNVAATGSIRNYNNDVNATVTSTGANVGGIVGQLANGAILSGTADAPITNKATVVGGSKVGGIVGNHNGGVAENVTYCVNYGSYSSSTGDAAVGSIAGNGYYDIATCVDYVNLPEQLTALSIIKSHVSGGQSTIAVSWTYPTTKPNMHDVVIFYKMSTSAEYSMVVVDDDELTINSYTLGELENITNNTTYEIYVASRNETGAQTGAMTSGEVVYSAELPCEVVIPE